MSRYFCYELHCHTNHSDGEMTPEELVYRAKQREYKGIAITDHNTFSAVDEVVKLGERYGLEVLEGIEWTTFYGHLTIIGGGYRQLDWREITKQNIDLMIQKAYRSGAIVTIVHPKRYGSPVCTGCYMDLDITKYEYVDAFEVWTQKCPNIADYNKEAIKMYDNLLKKGYKIAAVYGYDWHKKDYDTKPYAFTYIGKGNAQNAIKNGDTFVSFGLGFRLEVNNEELPLGSSLKMGKHTINIKIFEFNSMYCKKFGIKPKRIVLKGTALECNDLSIESNSPITLSLKKGYLRMEAEGEMEGQDGNTLLITSPLYIV